MLISFRKTVMHECSSNALAKLISCSHGTGDMAVAEKRVMEGRGNIVVGKAGWAWLGEA